MAKGQLNEGILDDLIDFIFDWVASGKKYAAEQKFKRDKAILQDLDDLDTIRKRLRKNLAKYGSEEVNKVLKQNRIDS